MEKEKAVNKHQQRIDTTPVLTEETKLLGIMSAIIYTRTGTTSNYGAAVDDAKAILELL